MATATGGHSRSLHYPNMFVLNGRAEARDNGGIVIQIIIVRNASIVSYGYFGNDVSKTGTSHVVNGVDGPR